MIAWTASMTVFAMAALLLAAWTIRIAKEYERGVVFRLGRLVQLKGPGPFKAAEVTS